MNAFYQPPTSPELIALLKQCDERNHQINQAKANHPALWPTILQKLRIEWTYNSNSIEGSTLSQGDTHFFLTQGLTVEGKPFQDFVDAQNHAEAIDFLYQVVSQQHQISEGLIKEINGLILSNVQYTTAKTPAGELVKKKASPGQYKTQSNHVLLPDGSIHRYVEPVQVPAQMQDLVKWIAENLQQVHPIICAGITHYNLFRIHAFDDGNGREARILMNLILMKKAYFPAVIKQERKRRYLEALSLADQGDLTPFIEFIANQLMHTQNQVIQDFQDYNQQ